MDALTVPPRDPQRDSDKLYFLHLMERYGPDVILIWWRNATADLYGERLPSPGLIGDPRR